MFKIKTIKFIPFLFAIALLFPSCEQESIDTIDLKTAVLEGYIFAGQGVDSIRITQSYSYSREDTTLIVLDDLEVSMSNEQYSAILEPAGNGYYQNPEFVIQSDKVYTIQFTHENKTVFAQTYVPLKRDVSISTEVIEMEQIEGGFGPGNITNQPDPIEISWDNPEGDYYYVLLENMEEEPEYINLAIQQFLEQNGEEIRRFSFITQPQITDFHSVNTRRDIQQFGLYRVIVFRVNPEYAALYESSGSSSLSLEEPPSNVENGLGIFTGVSSDTVYFEVKKI
ncbi:MAG: DUF4249 family protein [Bacteroidetes bacterium]|nr:DUF4249 family protein [Bacteroidota bacterium]